MKGKKQQQIHKSSFILKYFLGCNAFVASAQCQFSQLEIASMYYSFQLEDLFSIPDI